MDVSHLLDSLNDRQREAVSVEPGPILVLAGAGSGKTRVLTHRIAWVCEVDGLSPFSVLAVTFTNKAAAEMRARVESLLGISAAAMWVGTFHGLAHRMLRLHYEAPGCRRTFRFSTAMTSYAWSSAWCGSSISMKAAGHPNRRNGLSIITRTKVSARPTSIRGRTRSSSRCWRFTGYTRSCASVPGWWILPNCCCVYSS